MPLELSRSDRKLLLIAGGVFLVLVGISLLWVSPQSSKSDVPTTYSAGSGGAKAAYLLLKESGYRVERWEAPLLNVEAPSGKTLIVAEPLHFPTEAERDSVRKFTESGGRLIAIGPIAAFLLPNNRSAVDPIEGMTWQHFSALAPSPITRAAPQITLAPQAHWSLTSSALPLYGNDKQAVVVRYPYGKGEVIWWAAATPLTNAGLKETGNLEFLLACVGDKQNQEVLWDEYFHGYGDTRESSASAPLVKWMLAQFVLFGLAILLTFSRRSGPIRAPAPEIRLSPLEFVETLGGLYEHAQASAVAVDAYYQRFHYWITRRMGMTNSASVEDIEQTARDRWGFQEEQFAPTLRECASARYNPELPPKQALRLVQALHSYAGKLKLFPTVVKEKP